MTRADDEKLSENIGRYDAGDYLVTAAIWRTRIAGQLLDTFEIGIRDKSSGKFWLLQSEKWEHQSVQEVANAIAMLISDTTQNYTPDWCQEFFT